MIATTATYTEDEGFEPPEFFENPPHFECAVIPPNCRLSQVNHIRTDAANQGFPCVASRSRLTFLLIVARAA